MAQTVACAYTAEPQVLKKRADTCVTTALILVHMLFRWAL
ncbi:hypothetical protein RA210_U450005 [Rubrivivax sp. A210]|nr:hypothetical protein RA210_U450005 [Rubrivivax sp. A210]